MVANHNQESDTPKPAAIDRPSTVDAAPTLDVLELIVAEASAPAPVPQLPFLKPRHELLTMGLDYSHLLKAMLEKFSEASLLASGAIIREKTGELALHRAFGRNGICFRVERDPHSHVIGIESFHGRFGSPGPDWLALAGTVAGDEESVTPVLLVTNSVEMLIFDSLNLRYTLTPGLRTLSGSIIHRLFKLPDTTAPRRRFKFIFPLWDFANLQYEAKPMALATATHLANISHHFGYNPDGLFATWLPNLSQVGDIAEAAAYSDRSVLAKAFSGSIKSSCVPMSKATKVLKERLPMSYADTYAELEEAIRNFDRNPSGGSIRNALARFEGAFNAVVPRKLRAPELVDSVGNWLSFATADFADKWFHELTIVRAARRAIAGNNPGDFKSEFDFDAQLKFLQAIQQVYKLQRRY